jgi:hypothetical protein
MINTVNQRQLLALLNEAPGVRIKRHLFEQSLRDLFVLRGEATPKAPWLYDSTRVGEWQEYLAVRAELIRRGVWAETRPYDVLELEAIAQGNVHEEIVAELFPQEDENDCSRS